MKQTCHAARCIFLAFGLCLSSWAPMVPIVKGRLELNDAQLGLVLLVFGIGALIAMPLSGLLINRFGSRLITLIFGMLAIVLLPLLTVANTAISLSILLFLFGASTGITNVSINAQAVQIELQSNLPIMSGFHCLFSLGGLLGAVTVSILLELNLALPLCALTISFIIACLLLSQSHKLLSTQREKNSKNGNKGLHFPDRKILLLGVLCFIAFMAEGAMLDWSAEFLHSSLDYETSIAGIGYAIFSITMALGRLVGGRLIQRFSTEYVFQGGALTSAIGFLLVVNGYGYVELIGFSLIGFGAANLVPILFSTSGKLSVVSSNYALTIVTTFGYLGILFGPAFIGFISQATTLSFALAAISLLLIAVALSGRNAVRDHLTHNDNSSLIPI